MTNSRIQGFRNLSVEERRSVVTQQTGVDAAILAAFDEGGFGSDAADHLSENVIGTFSLPIGIAANHTINGRDVLVPMVTEEA